MKLSIIIVSFNTVKLLHNCLLVLYQALEFAKLEKDSEVIIIDNASTDGSSQMVKTAFPQATLIKNKENLGFAKANNQGIKKAGGEYILLLNSDTEVDKKAIGILYELAKRNKNVAVVGGKLLNKDRSLQYSVGFFPDLIKIFFWMTFIDDLPIFSTILKPYHVTNSKFYDSEHMLDWVSGACMFIKKKFINRVGLFDEKIFMYGEEVEWCYRWKKAGYGVCYTPKAIIYHFKGGSGEGLKAGIIEEFDSLKYFYQKHKPIWQFKTLSMLLFFGALLRILLFGIIMRNSQRAHLYVKAIQMAR